MSLSEIKVIRAGEGSEALSPLPLVDLRRGSPPTKTGSRATKFAMASYLARAMDRPHAEFTLQFQRAKEESAEEKPEETEAPQEPPPPPLPTPEEIVAEARQSAMAEAAKIKEEARQEGHRQGVEQGRQEMLAAAAGFLAEAKALAALGPGLLAEMEPEIIGLAITAAGKLAGMEIDRDSQPAINAVKAGLKMLSQSKWVKIRINPDELDVIKSMAPEMQGVNPRVNNLEFLPDPQVSRGGCLVQSESEEIDASLEAREASLAEVMDKSLKGLLESV